MVTLTLLARLKCVVTHWASSRVCAAQSHCHAIGKDGCDGMTSTSVGVLRSMLLLRLVFHLQDIARVPSPIPGRGVRNSIGVTNCLGRFCTIKYLSGTTYDTSSTYTVCSGYSETQCLHRPLFTGHCHVS